MDRSRQPNLRQPALCERGRSHLDHAQQGTVGWDFCIPMDGAQQSKNSIRVREEFMPQLCLQPGLTKGDFIHKQSTLIPGGILPEGNLGVERYFIGPPQAKGGPIWLPIYRYADILKITR